MPQVARALIESGVAEIGESRLENVHRLRAGGVTAPIVLLRIPQLSSADEIVTSVDMSLNSEVSVVQELSRSAENLGKTLAVILMVDLGDLREGFWPDDLLPAARAISELSGVRITGIGTNLSCYGGVMPTEVNMRTLVEHARRVEDVLGARLEIISGGNSSSLPLVAEGRMPPEVNHLRIGEAILLGRETIRRSPWPGTVQDAFRVSAEVIELKPKPSVPIGETAEDAFGGRPQFADRGRRLRAILNIGREDVDIAGLHPCLPGVSVVGASSDHLILDAGPAPGAGELGGAAPGTVPPGAAAPGSAANSIRIGDEIQFLPNYSALLAAMTSAYIEKRVQDASDSGRRPMSLVIHGDSPVFSGAERRPEIASLGYTVRRQSAGHGTGETDADGCLPIFAGGDMATVEGWRLLASRIAGREGGTPGLLWIAPLPDLPTELLAADGAQREVPVPDTEGQYLSAENLVFLCLQDSTADQQAMIRRLRLEAYTMEDVDLVGVREVVRAGMRRAASGTRGLYVRFDPRCADNGREGLTNREVHLALELIARSGLLRALDISGYTPSGTRETERLRRFVLSALGKRILAR